MKVPVTCSEFDTDRDRSCISLYRIDFRQDREEEMLISCGE
jgi:hypothetical protein